MNLYSMLIPSVSIGKLNLGWRYALDQRLLVALVRNCVNSLPAVSLVILLLTSTLMRLITLPPELIIHLIISHYISTDLRECEHDLHEAGRQYYQGWHIIESRSCHIIDPSTILNLSSWVTKNQQIRLIVSNFGPRIHELGLNDLCIGTEARLRPLSETTSYQTDWLCSL